MGLVVRLGGAAEPPLPADIAPPSTAPADPITLDFGPQAGFGYRFSGSAGFPIGNRSGGVLGGSIAVSPSRSYSVALRYEHSALGSEHGAGDVAHVDLTRSLDVVWASLRLAFLRTDRFLVLAQLGPGLAFQHVDASALVYRGAGRAPAPFSCGETAGPDLGLRAGLGLEARLNRSLWVSLDTVVDNLRLSSDPLGTCAPGAGSVALVGLRLGFTYRLDVSRFLR